jgi:hypothetical protein
MEGGRVIAEGTHDDLIATVPAYAEILAHAADDDVAHVAAIEAEEERRHDDAEAAVSVSLGDPVRGGD